MRYSWCMHMTNLKLPHRRQFLHLAASAAAFPTVPRIARAQAYPTRPVRIIVGYAAGGATDTVARMIGQGLSEHLGQQFVIDNRPGAGSNIATEAVVRASPDGYTLLLASSSNAINATLYEKLNFNFIRDIAPVAGLQSEPHFMLVNPSFPARTVPEFVAYAKANPGKVSMASAGIGSSPHLAGELFKMMTGVDLIHVPYRGGTQALADLIGGQVQVYFGLPSSCVEYVRASKLRALAVTTASRSDALPNVPTMIGFVPGYEAITWYGVGAPKNTPAETIAKLNRAINAALANSKMKAWLADIGDTALAGSPANFGKLIAEDTEKWAKVIKFAGIKAD
jgi:tripartite-type tricarboxylate transporter receptor subunit TctC